MPYKNAEFTSLKPEYVYCSMGRILNVIILLLVLGACTRSPEFVVHDQVLEWPALDSVTDIRSQLVFDGEAYLLAGELSILSLKDTLPSTQAEVLYTFHDSTWEYYTHQKWPDRKIYKPADINDDYFRTMPACYINRIFPFDKDNLLVLLVLNSIVSEPESGSSSARRNQISFLFDKKNGEMRPLPGLTNTNHKIGDITYQGEFDDRSSIKVVKTGTAFIPYSTGLYYYVDSNHLDNVSGVVSYNSKTDKLSFFTDPPNTASWIPGKLLADQRTIYALTEQGASILVQFDTAGSYLDFFRDAAFFSSNDLDICAVRLIWDETRADFTLQLAHIEQNGTENIFHEINNVTIPGRTFYEADNGKLIFFYEKEAEIHQLIISKK